MKPIIHLDRSSSGSGSMGWSGQVEFRGDLPITIGSPAIGEVYLVEKPTTILLGAFTTYQSGLYIRESNSGSLSDWRRLNVKVNFTDTEFAIVNSLDQSKRAIFDLSIVTSSTTRSVVWQDKDGTMALLSDIPLTLPPEPHSSTHTDGTDDIQDATSSQKGLATSTQISKLDSIEAGAQVNDVDSVFGRTGPVTAQPGDYDSDQVSEGSTNLYNRVPTGGSAGQVLKKTSSTDYDLEWGDDLEGVLEHGECYFSTTNGVETTIGASNTPVKIEGVTTPGLLSANISMPANNRLQWNGSGTKRFIIHASVTGNKTQGGGQDQYTVYVNQNGATLTRSKQGNFIGGGNNREIHVQTIVDLASGEFVEIWCENNDTADDITFLDLNLLIKEIPS